MPRSSASVALPTILGVFLISLATLSYQVLLTRIFSVTTWYHFAFVGISLAMFGMTAGALWVFMRPGLFPEAAATRNLARHCFGFGISIALCFPAYLAVPFRPAAGLPGALGMILGFGLVAIPFAFSGVVICVALTQFRGAVSRLYAADLIGAALGCLAVFFTLEWMAGPTAVLACALPGGLAGLLFALAADDAPLKRRGAITVAALGCVVALAFATESGPKPLVPVMWVKGHFEEPGLWERWNSFSRIRVSGNPDRPRVPFGWGMSPRMPADTRTRELNLEIDGGASTPVTHFNQDLATVGFLRYDIINLAHRVRSNRSVFVIGAGGGRDILSAFLFGQARVTAAEINGRIAEAANERFGDFTGHLNRDPRVRYINDEGRSFLTQSGERFGLIQVSLVDTWAATASGAFVLAENALYTMEAFRLFWRSLEDDGVFSCSRWYWEAYPGEACRLITLAAEALRSAGVTDPRKHLFVAWVKRPMNIEGPSGICTLVMSRAPWSESDLTTLRQTCAGMDFRILLDPGHAENSTIERLASGGHWPGISRELAVDLAPPTDDRPFFFQMIRLGDLLTGRVPDAAWLDANMGAVRLLALLAVAASAAAALLLRLPLRMAAQQGLLGGAAPKFAYFAAIGVGFLMIEIAQMQRLTLFLGHPSYGLAAVLFALLLASGLGSASCGGTIEGKAARFRLSVLLGVVFLIGLLTGPVLHAFTGAPLATRLLAAMGVLVPAGFVMGTAFPLGMQWVHRTTPPLAPWLWAVNGALSVCASVFAIIVAMFGGIAASYWIGVACYAVAWAAFEREPAAPARLAT